MSVVKNIPQIFYSKYPLNNSLKIFYEILTFLSNKSHSQHYTWLNPSSNNVSAYIRSWPVDYKKLHKALARSVSFPDSKKKLKKYINFKLRLSITRIQEIIFRIPSNKSQLGTFKTTNNYSWSFQASVKVPKTIPNCQRFQKYINSFFSSI